MRCAWNTLIRILPNHLRRCVDGQLADNLLELRLRKGKPVELVTLAGSRWLPETATEEDLNFIIHTASQYSPWSASSMANGFLTVSGGHRIGICGECVCKAGIMTGFQRISGLCIRISRDFQGISKGIPMDSVLVLGAPGSGKTTLLRDLIRRISDQESGAVTVVDERGELFPREADFPTGKRTDVLTGCSKEQGIELALRTMGPAWIAVDEITSEEDCAALLKAGWCGVRLLATAHAGGIKDLYSRSVYRPLVERKLFQNVVVMGMDKSWRLERTELCY